MTHRLALLVLIAVLVLADLAGALWLHAAWSDRHHKAAAAATPAVAAQPAMAVPTAEASAAHAGT